MKAIENVILKVETPVGHTNGMSNSNNDLVAVPKKTMAIAFQ